MRKFIALLLSAALLAVGCEGGFDISSIFKDYLPDPVTSDAILEVDQEGNYLVAAEGGELSVDLSDVKQCLNIDLVSQFLVAISEDGMEWIHISRLDDITEGTLVVDVDENATEQKRYADIVLRPADNDYIHYTINLVQMPAGYIHDTIQ